MAGMRMPAPQAQRAGRGRADHPPTREEYMEQKGHKLPEGTLWTPSAEFEEEYRKAVRKWDLDHGARPTIEEYLGIPEGIEWIPTPGAQKAYDDAMKDWEKTHPAPQRPDRDVMFPDPEPAPGPDLIFPEPGGTPYRDELRKAGKMPRQRVQQEPPKDTEDRKYVRGKYAKAKMPPDGGGRDNPMWTMAAFEREELVRLADESGLTKEMLDSLKDVRSAYGEVGLSADDNVLAVTGDSILEYLSQTREPDGSRKEKTGRLLDILDDMGSVRTLYEMPPEGDTHRFMPVVDGSGKDVTEIRHGDYVVFGVYAADVHPELREEAESKIDQMENAAPKKMSAYERLLAMNRAHDGHGGHGGNGGSGAPYPHATDAPVPAPDDGKGSGGGKRTAYMQRVDGGVDEVEEKDDGPEFG